MNLNYIEILDGHDHDQLLSLISGSIESLSSPQPTFLTAILLRAMDAPLL